MLWILALQMSGKNRNRYESPIGVWKNPVCKTSWTSLPVKQGITVGSIYSSDFNVKLLYWSSKAYVSRNTSHFLDASSCLSLILNTPGYTPIRYSLRLSQSGICDQLPQQKRVIITGVSYPLFPIPLPLLLPAYPLPLLAPATQDTIASKTFFFLEFFDVV